MIEKSIVSVMVRPGLWWNVIETRHGKFYLDTSRPASKRVVTPVMAAVRRGAAVCHVAKYRPFYLKKEIGVK